MSRVRQKLRLLLEVDEPPHRIALAYGVGIWLSFFPILGVHTAMAIAIALLFRLSKVAILLGTWTNTPWTVPPTYTFGTFIGCLLLGVSTENIRSIDWGSLTKGSWSESLWRAVEVLRPFWWPYVLGNTLLGILGGVAAYYLIRSFLERRRGGAP